MANAESTRKKIKFKMSNGKLEKMQFKLQMPNSKVQMQKKTLFPFKLFHFPF